MIPEQYPKIVWPEPDDLDTGDWSSHSGNQVAVYLIPPAESRSDSLELYTFTSIGQPSSMPHEAWAGRWVCVAIFREQVRGTVALELLKRVVPEIRAAAAGYKGSTWNGSNHIGKWDDEAVEALQSAIDEAVADCEKLNYWQAADWLGEISLEDLCRMEEIAYPAILHDDKLLEQLAEKIEATAASDGIAVSGLAATLKWLRDEALEALEAAGE